MKINVILGSTNTGECFTQSRLNMSSPPESFNFDSKHWVQTLVVLNDMWKLLHDVWSFGKLIYDVIVGKSLMFISSTTSKNNNAKNNVKTNNDYNSLSTFGSWDDNDSLNCMRGQLCKFFHHHDN